MGMGFCGRADLEQEDESIMIYSYCCYNLNDKNYESFCNIKDGEIYIDRDALVEPDIHVKTKKIGRRKKTITKRVKRDVPFDKLFEQGKVQVKNASGTWRTYFRGIDIIAMHILFNLFNEYQETGEIPKRIIYFN